jgi:putative intracellular protease/amidase
MIYIYLAEGYEETEMLFPLDLMRRAGLDVYTVSVTGKKEVTGSHGITVVADMTVSDAFEKIKRKAIDSDNQRIEQKYKLSFCN